MKYKVIIGLVAALIAVSCLISACSGGSDKATPDSASVQETTVIIETTADGGTIEQDPEGNKITKDDKGNILSVEDKDGKTVDVETYIITHSWVVNNSSTGSSGGLGKSSGSGGSSSSGQSEVSGSVDGSGESSSSGSDSGSSSISGSSDRDDTVEESIPVIIATIPDDENLEKLPDL